jgi:hypothetical protein
MFYEPLLCAALIYFSLSSSKYNQSAVKLSIEVLPFLGVGAWEGQRGSCRKFGLRVWYERLWHVP